MKSRNGVLGLDTAKTVMITFLTLAVIGISILLALTSLSDGVTNTIDVRSTSITVINETGVYINETGYTLAEANSTNGAYVITALWNATDDGAGSYNLSIPITNATVSSTGIVTNASTFVWDDVSASYTYTHTYSKGQVSSIVENVSNGVVTFFASTGTIFSILIVVVIILAISIIIWAVGRFGNRAEGSVSL